VSLADPQQLGRLPATQPPRTITLQSFDIPRHPYLGSHPNPPVWSFQKPDRSSATKSGHIICYAQPRNIAIDENQKGGYNFTKIIVRRIPGYRNIMGGEKYVGTIHRIAEVLTAATFVAVAMAGSAIAQSNPQCPSASTAVTTYHYDNLRTGWNCHETTLTPANVAHPTRFVESFSWLYSVTLDELVKAQPLFVPNQRITFPNQSKGIFDVVYVATENNTIYAIDAATGSVLLPPKNLGTAVPSKTINGGRCFFTGNVGINSTPVIDLASGVMYVIAYTTNSGSNAYYIHELDLSTLNDVVPPVLVSASYTINVRGGSTFKFNAAEQQQSAGLVLAHGSVYAGFASFCDKSRGPSTGGSRGWLIGWNAVTLAALPLSLLTNADLNTSARPLAAIWMSGYGVAADDDLTSPSKGLYFVTGNSDDSYNPGFPYISIQESVLRMSFNLTTIGGIFTPANHSNLDSGDLDFGAGGVMLLPPQPGRHGSMQYLAVAAGKCDWDGVDGGMYVLDRANLTRVSNGNAIGWCLCGPSYYHTGGTGGVGHIVSSGGAQLIVWAAAPLSSPLHKEASYTISDSSCYDTPQCGFFTSVSSNGETNPIIWAVVQANNEVRLYAFDPNQLKPIFSSALAGTWASPGKANIVPVVANGRVYVASDRQLNVFGLTGDVPVPPR
jgi:outer membrane protein assembly factor BamB